MGARREVVSAVAERYRPAKRAEKGRILDELCATTGWHRKHAVRALRQRETVMPGEVGASREKNGARWCNSQDFKKRVRFGCSALFQKKWRET